MDKLTALRAFREAVDQGSFAGAARRLGLSPAAISKNIGELEAHLGTRLLNRTTRRMSLTEAGEDYFGRIRRVLRDLEDADTSLTAMRAQPRGTLRVSAPMTLSLIALTPHIPGFLDRYPDVSLDLSLDDRRINIVEEGVDLALRGTDQLENSSLIARKLMVLDHVLCASPDYLADHGCPRHPRDLAHHNCLRFSLSGHANSWTFSRDGKETTVPVTGRYTAGSSLAIRDALQAGFGISLIPRIYVADDLASGTLTQVLGDWQSNRTPVYAVYPSRQYLVPKVRCFIDFLAETLGPA